MSLDVVVVSYECREAVRRCLASLQGAADDAVTIVVDNASTDGTGAMIRSEFPTVRLIENERNIGFGAAVNRGARSADGDHLLLLNPDAEVTAAAIARLRATLEGAPTIGGVGPCIRDDRGELELSRGRTMSPVSEARFKILGAIRRAGPVQALLERAYGQAAETRSLTAACLLLRRAAFEAVGGFDERFFLYGEDVDLCRRLVEAGWRLRYEPRAEVRHARGVSAAARPEATEIAYRRSQLAFYAKYHPRWVAGLLGLYLRARYRWSGLVGGAEGAARARRIRDALERPGGEQR